MKENERNGEKNKYVQITFYMTQCSLDIEEINV